MKVVTYTKTTYELMSYDEFRTQFEEGSKFTLPNGKTYEVAHVDIHRSSRLTYGDGPLIGGWWAGSITLLEEHRGEHVELIIERGNVYWTTEERTEREIADVGRADRGSTDRVHSGVPGGVPRRKEPLGLSCTAAAYKLAGEILDGRDEISTRRGIKAHLGLAAMIDEVRGTPDTKTYFTADIQIH